MNEKITFEVAKGVAFTTEELSKAANTYAVAVSALDAHRKTRDGIEKKIIDGIAKFEAIKAEGSESWAAYESALMDYEGRLKAYQEAKKRFDSAKAAIADFNFRKQKSPQSFEGKVAPEMPDIEVPQKPEDVPDDIVSPAFMSRVAAMVSTGDMAAGARLMREYFKTEKELVAEVERARDVFINAYESFSRDVSGEIRNIEARNKLAKDRRENAINVARTKKEKAEKALSALGANG